MRRENNGTWMLWMAVVAAVITPSVVIAGQRGEAAGPTSQRTVAALPTMEALVEQAKPAVTSCYNMTCTSHTQCRLWCDEPSAKCVPSEWAPHYKFCFLP